MISVLVAKLVLALLRMLNRGATTLPGRIALKINPNILSFLSKGVKVICVTGTNGKTTTCALISSVLKSNDISYFTNKSGANMLTGVVTAFIENSSLFGRCKSEYAILECDENSLPIIADYLNANIVAVTNIFRDQLDRYGEVDYTLNQISLAISKLNSPTLVLNADCPLTMTLQNDNTITYGISSKTEIKSMSDIRYCPYCDTELSYNSVVYAHLGDYYCPKCGYHRHSPNYDMKNLSDDNIRVALKGTYNLYNILSAYSVCRTMGIDKLDSLSSFYGSFGRTEMFKHKDITILLLLVKNPVGYANCIDLVKLKGKIFNIAFALNDNSADGTDVSWIWDVDFSPISSLISDSYTLGTRSYDMALRLKYNDIFAKPLSGESYNDLVSIIKSSNQDFVIFSTYTSMMSLRHYLVDEFGGEEFWQ